MNKFLFSLVLGCVFFNTGDACAEPKFIPLGDLKFYPYIEMQYQHDDNFFLSDANKRSSNITVIKPAMSLQLEREILQVKFNYGLSKGIVHHSRQDDYLDHKAEVLVDVDVSKRLHVAVSSGYLRSHDARGTTFSGLALLSPSPDKWHATGVALAITYGVNAIVKFTGDYTNKRYDSNRSRTLFRDLDTAGAGILFSLPIGVKTSAVVEARYRKFDYKLSSILSSLDSSEQSYLLGADWNATAKTKGSVRVGYLKKSFLSSGQGASGNFDLELDMSWSPLTYSMLNLSMMSSTIETDGVGGFIKTKHGTLAWDYDWSARVSHSIFSSYTRNIYAGNTAARMDKEFDAGISVEYKLRRWLALEAGYSYGKRISDIINASYKRNILTLNVSTTL